MESAPTPRTLDLLLLLGLLALGPGVVTADDQDPTPRDVPAALAEASHEALATDSMRALLLAREAFARRPDVTTRSALYSALARTYERALLRGHEGPLTSVDADVDRIVTGSVDGTARTWTRAGVPTATLDAGRPVRDVALLYGVGEVLTVSDATAAGRVDLRLWAAGEGRILAEGLEREAFAVSPARMHVLVRTGPGAWRLVGKAVTEIRATSVAFGPRGARLIVVRGAGEIAIRDIASGREDVLRDVPGATAAVFDDAGDRLVVYGAGSTVWLLDGRGQRLAAFEHRNPVEAVAIARDSAYLVTATSEDTITVWSLRDAEVFATKAVGAPVRSVEINPKGTWIKAHLEAGGYAFYDIDLGDRHPLADPEETVAYSTMDPWGRWDLSTGGDGRVVLINFVSRQPVRLLGHTMSVVDAAFTADGFVATASEDGTARLWRVAQEGTPVLGGHQHHVYGGAFLQASDRVVTMAWSDSFLWDLDGRRVAHRTHARLPAWWAFCPDAFGVALEEQEHVIVFDAEGDEVRRLDHGAEVSGLAWLPNGERFLSWSTTWRTVRVYDREGDLLGIVQQDDPILTALFQSRDRVATLGPADTVRITTVRGERKAEWTLPEPAGSLSRAGDGRHLFTVAKDGSVARLFDVAGKQVLALDGHDDAILSVDLSPRPGVRVLTGSKDGTAKLWDGDGKRLAVLEHPAAVTSVSFLQDDRRFATACEDGALRIFARDGEPWAVLHGHAAALTGFHFTRHGDQVLTLSKDFTARLWPGTDAALRRAADARAGRGFTSEERATYADLLDR